MRKLAAIRALNGYQISECLSLGRNCSSIELQRLAPVIYWDVVVGRNGRCTQPCTHPRFWGTISTPPSYLPRQARHRYAHPMTELATTKPVNGWSIAALTLAIVGLGLMLASKLVFFVPILGVAAIVFGAVGVRRSRQTGRGFGLGLAGLLVGVVPAGVGLLAWVMAAVNR